MKELPLPTGEAVMLDDEDFEWAQQYRWQIVWGEQSPRVGRYIGRRPRFRYLKHDVLNCLGSTRVAHIDKNYLNCQKHNLRFGYDRCLPTPNPKLAAIEQPTVKDIYWAAGIYEGEGSCQDTSPSGSGLPSAAISQKDTWLLHKLVRLFGGKVYKRDKHDACNMWVLNGARATGFLLTIYSLLSPRRQSQIRHAIAVKRQPALKESL